LPRYDAQERLVAKGHALPPRRDSPTSCAAMSTPRTAMAAGSYDFVPYLSSPKSMCPSSRRHGSAADVAQNPEWAYVRRGPEWWGRRVGRAAALWEI
jgi:hypothetical protein